MRRLAPGLALPILVGLPLWVAPSWGVSLLVAVSGALCILAILRASLSIATAGGAIALISVSLAFRHTTPSGDALVPAVYGLALLLFIDGIQLCKRFEGAAVAATFWRRQFAWWTARGAISLAGAILISIFASLIAILLPVPWAPFLAGLGILGAFAAAMAFAGLSTDD